MRIYPSEIPNALIYLYTDVYYCNEVLEVMWIFDSMAVVKLWYM